MENLKIERVTLQDVTQLQDVSIRTFSETFAAVNTEENMNSYLEASFSTQQLTTELSNPLCRFYFAVLHGEVIGYLKLNSGEAQTDIKDNHALEIERIYVAKEFHGKGVAQQLYSQAMEIAGIEKAGYVWLGVWEKNPRAISFYRKNGFVEFHQHVFMLGTDEQIDILMKKNLKKD